jgi:hypothetical protein
VPLCSFWAWDNIGSYLEFLLSLAAVIAVPTILFFEVPMYVEGLGVMALGIESTLALPQVHLACACALVRASCTGGAVIAAVCVDASCSCGGNGKGAYPLLVSWLPCRCERRCTETTPRRAQWG